MHNTEKTQHFKSMFDQFSTLRMKDERVNLFQYFS